ncbi:MAG: hypothetical protein K1000chlam4_00362 [Chlamydiae bacterium]|nr:hypothetical protein [Chlamydiota bacterium]
MKKSPVTSQAIDHMNLKKSPFGRLRGKDPNLIDLCKKLMHLLLKLMGLVSFKRELGQPKGLRKLDPISSLKLAKLKPAPRTGWHQLRKGVPLQVTRFVQSNNLVEMVGLTIEFKRFFAHEIH